MGDKRQLLLVSGCAAATSTIFPRRVAANR